MTGIPGVVASEVPEQAEEMAELRRRIAACFQFVLDRQSFLTSPSPTSSAPEAVFHSAPPGPRVKVSHVFTEGQDTYSSQEVPGRSCFAGLQLPTRPVGTSCKSTTLRAGTRGGKRLRLEQQLGKRPPSQPPLSTTSSTGATSFRNPGCRCFSGPRHRSAIICPFFHLLQTCHVSG